LYSGSGKKSAFEELFGENGEWLCLRDVADGENYSHDSTQIMTGEINRNLKIGIHENTDSTKNPIYGTRNVGSKV
jgi:hypothetical protein